MVGQAVKEDDELLDMRVDRLVQAVEATAVFVKLVGEECRRTAAVASELLDLVAGMKVVMVAKAA